MKCKRCGLPFSQKYPQWKDYRTHGSVDFCLRAHQEELERLREALARLERLASEPLEPTGDERYDAGCEAMDAIYRSTIRGAIEIAALGG